MGAVLEDWRVMAARVALRRRRRRHAFFTFIKLVVGLSVLAAAPVGGSLLLCSAARLAGYAVPWASCLTVLALIFVPLLLWMEWRTRGQFLSHVLADGAARLEDLHPLGRLPGPHVALGGLAMVAFWRNPLGLIGGFIELLLLGPRLILEVARDRRLRRKLGRIDYRRAAEVLARLDAAGGGLPLTALLRSGERSGDLVALLRWLAEDEWVGVTADGQRVYLYTPGRNELQRLAQRP